MWIHTNFFFFVIFQIIFKLILNFKIQFLIRLLHNGVVTLIIINFTVNQCILLFLLYNQLLCVYYHISIITILTK